MTVHFHLPGRTVYLDEDAGLINASPTDYSVEAQKMEIELPVVVEEVEEQEVEQQEEEQVPASEVRECPHEESASGKVRGFRRPLHRHTAR